MRNRQSRVLDTLHAVQAFLDEHVDVIGNAITSARQSVDQVEGELSSFAEAQRLGTSQSRGETNRQRALRAALRNDHIRPIAEVARQKLRDVPEFSDLGMPRRNATSTQLVTFANAMAQAAAPHEQVFKEVGLPDDFIAGLTHAASVLAESVVQRDAHAGRQVGATSGLAAQARRAVSMIRLVDAIVRPKLGTNDALIRQWQAAKRVPRKPHNSADAAATDPATPPVTTPVTPPVTMSVTTPVTSTPQAA